MPFNDDKASEALSKLIDIFNEKKLTVHEIAVVYANLGYILGASIEGYQEKGPPVSELEKIYYTDPRIGIGLMLQGQLLLSWAEDYEKKKAT